MFITHICRAFFAYISYNLTNKKYKNLKVTFWNPTQPHYCKCSASKTGLNFFRIKPHMAFEAKIKLVKQNFLIYIHIYKSDLIISNI